MLLCMSLTNKVSSSLQESYIMIINIMSYLRGDSTSFKCYVTQVGGGGVRFSGKKRYKGVRFNVISITKGWVWVQFPEKKHDVTLECNT